MSRPTDHLQPSGKRRPGAQLTKDDVSDDDDGPVVDPGTWGKADEATLARRKIVRARRGAAAAEPARTPAAPEAVGANPFAGVSLTSTIPAKPFAGVSLAGAAKATDQSPAQQDEEQETPATAGTAAANGATEVAAAYANTEAKALSQPQGTEKQPAEQQSAVAEDKQQGAEGEEQEAATADKPSATAAAADDQAAADAKAAATDKPAGDNKPSSDAVPSTALFGSSGGFGGFGSTGGFGNLTSGSGFAGGFGGFAAANKDGAAGGSLFGSFKPPEPGNFLGGSIPAFGATKQPGTNGDTGTEHGEGGKGAEGEGDAVFGGNDNIVPVVQLTEVPKQTGEEQEETVFTTDGTLFEFVNGKEWRERGKGELRVNINKATQQSRLVMRQRGSHRLLLNANLYPSMTTSKMVGGKGVTFAAVNAAAVSANAAADADSAGQEVKEDNGSSQEAPGSATKDCGTAVMRTYALKVKTPESINTFVATVDSYKAGVPAEQHQQPNPDAF